MAKSRKGTVQKTYMQAKRQEKQQKENVMFSLIVFAVVALIVLVINVMALDTSVVQACLLMIVEAGLAVMLHKSELWMHGVLLIAEIVAGVIVGNVVLVIMCAIIYIAATVTLKLIYTGEE